MLEIRSLTKTFAAADARLPAVAVVNDVCLKIGAGEFFSLLGPSGCGKTTLLRMIAGFEIPTRGEILHAGRAIEHFPPEKRPFNLVFQKYALFPHLTVGANLGFGPALQKLAKTEVPRRVAEMLSLVRLEGYESRRIDTLSGGQQQRVALARALINRPEVLLLDEPLSALDLKLRQEMRVELLEIQRRLKHTFIFVTHDQEEALGLSDRIAVMNAGKVEQVGTPREIYESPATAFVARFIGSISVARGKVRDGRVLLPSGESLACGSPLSPEAEVELMVRPEKLSISAQDAVGARVTDGRGPENRLAGVLVETLYQGRSTDFVVQTSAGRWQATRPSGDGEAAGLEPGQLVQLRWNREDSLVFPIH